MAEVCFPSKLSRNHWLFLWHTTNTSSVLQTLCGQSADFTLDKFSSQLLCQQKKLFPVVDVLKVIFDISRGFKQRWWGRRLKTVLASISVFSPPAVTREICLWFVKNEPLEWCARKFYDPGKSFYINYDQRKENVDTSLFPPSLPGLLPRSLLTSINFH